jgi:hypothetical protein
MGAAHSQGCLHQQPEFDAFIAYYAGIGRPGLGVFTEKIAYHHFIEFFAAIDYPMLNTQL